MTRIGQILVVVNLGLSFCFLAIAVAVSASRADLREQIAKNNKDIGELKKDKDNLEADKGDLEAKLADAKVKIAQLDVQAKDTEDRLSRQVADWRAKEKISKDLADQKTQLAENLGVELEERKTEVADLRVKLQTTLVEKAKLSSDKSQ